MIPDYLKFIRYQDKRLIPFFYVILLVLLGFYWKNNAYSVSAHDAWFISGILAITLFNLIYDLKAYWIYKYTTKNVDCGFFEGKRCTNVETFLSRPIVVGIISVFVFWGVIQCGFLLSAGVFGIIGLYLVLPLLIYFVFRWLRASYIIQLITNNHIQDIAQDKVKYTSLYQYAGHYILFSTLLNILTISPLKRNPDFSLTEGYLTPKLVIAMLILCAIVLVINLAFSRLSKRYIFMGKIFLKEIDFSFSPSIPFAALNAHSLVFRMTLLLVIQFVWILFMGLLLTALGWNMPFEIYFTLCFLPSVGYYYLHIYWLWHIDFAITCDMCMRRKEIEKRTNLW
jgi:hypothetical protein